MALQFLTPILATARVGVLTCWGNFGGTLRRFSVFVLVVWCMCVVPLAPRFTNPQVIVYLRVLLFVLVAPTFRGAHGCPVVFVSVHAEGNVKGTHGAEKNLGQNHHKT